MNSVSFVGNLTSDPKLTFGDAGKARATFSVAVNEGQGDAERTHFLNVTAWGSLAENLAESLSKGQRVLVIGRVNTYSKDVTIDGDDKSITMVSFTASAVGPDLRWALAKVTKVTREDSGKDGEGEGGGNNSSKRSGSSSTRQSAGRSRAAAAPDDSDDF